MDSMQEFWACQWLLTNIGETNKTQEILKAIEIAQSEGYIRMAISRQLAKTM